MSKEAKIEKAKARLDIMNSAQLALKDEIDGRAEERGVIVSDHNTAVTALQAQIEALTNANTTRLMIFDAETAAKTERRTDIKTDYGNLYEAVGLIESADAEPAPE